MVLVLGIIGLLESEGGARLVGGRCASAEGMRGWSGDSWSSWGGWRDVGGEG
jgi:hypothetical protein